MCYVMPSRRPGAIRLVAYFEPKPEPCTSPPSHGFVAVTTAVVGVATDIARTGIAACAGAHVCAGAATDSVQARPNVEWAISVVVIVRPPSEIWVGLVVRAWVVR